MIKKREKKVGDAFYRIHNVNSTFVKVFSIPLYFLSIIIVYLLLIFPYSFRIALAYVINIFFNRPIVYLTFFFEKFGKHINKIVITFFYLIILGFYSFFFRIFCFFSKKKKSEWNEIDKDTKESYNFMS